MNDKISALIDQIASLENDLRDALAEHGHMIQRDVVTGRKRFEDEILRRHKAAKQGFFAYFKNSNPFSIVTAPFIYSLIFPLFCLDVLLALYQTVCFPVYGLKKVRRSDYILFDRLHLAYLNPVEKLNCAYCSYANGLIAYAREIAGRTEAFWCPIKHAKTFLGPHAYYKDFLDYGDADGYARKR